jgi:hypothetical protein
MQQILNAPLFLWPRGKRGRWKLTAGPDAQITYGDQWPSLSDADCAAYSPLGDPHIFEAFAEVGRAAIDAGISAIPSVSADTHWIVGDVLRGLRDYPGAYESALAQRRAVAACEDVAVRATVLDFLGSYGAPEDSSAARSIPVGHFILAAADMAEAVRIVAFDETHPRWLDETINEHLQGVHPTSWSASQLGGERGRYGFTCDSLLTAMWWQFVQADAGGGAWRVCKGCPRTFVQTRTDQEYHDKNCRNRANVRKHAKGGSR